MKPQRVSYILEEAQNVKIETAKRGRSLFIQIKTNREITTEEAVSQKQDSPMFKIIAAMDKVLPKTNAACADEQYVIIHPPRPHINQFTVEVKNFYDFPADLEYMKGKLVRELKTLKL